jgi:hypothetical protein
VQWCSLADQRFLLGTTYGGFVITNAAHNNPNVTDLVYVAALGPDEGESPADLVDVAMLPKEDSWSLIAADLST